MTIEQYSVEQEGMMNVSDHLPLLADFFRQGEQVIKGSVLRSELGFQNSER